MSEKKQSMPSKEALDTAVNTVHNLVTAIEGLGNLREALMIYQQAATQQATLGKTVTALQRDVDAHKARLAEVQQACAALEDEYAAKRTTAEADMQTVLEGLAQQRARLQGLVHTEQANLQAVKHEQGLARQQAQRLFEAERTQVRADLARRYEEVRALKAEIGELTGQRDKLRHSFATVMGEVSSG
jgi:chromosome segregation ATPase